MTIGAQSVSAIMPNRIAFVSGESSAYTLPTQPAGSPDMSPAMADTPAVCFRNVRRDGFVRLIYLSNPNSMVVTITYGARYDLPGVAAFRNAPVKICAYPPCS